MTQPPSNERSSGNGPPVAEPLEGTLECLRRRIERLESRLAALERKGNGNPRPRRTEGGASSDRKTRVLVVDDHEIFRQGLADLLARQEDLHLAGQAGSGEEALTAVRRVRPDVIVMDVNLPDMSGMEVTRAVKHVLPEVTVIGLSVHARSDVARSMIEAGAEAYFTKGAPSTELVKAIRSSRAPGPPGPTKS